MWIIQDAWSFFNKDPWHENLSLGTCQTWATTKGTGTISMKVFCGILLLLDHLQGWDEIWKKVNEH
jgi:hypothetical protein